eukprot:SAG25_NODE_204_length_11947_cov_29.018822_3_plen_124_part_00
MNVYGKFCGATIFVNQQPIKFDFIVADLDIGCDLLLGMPLGLGEWVKRPTLCIGDNRNARDWANEKVISEGNQHLDRHYFIIRERVQKGEILPVWIEGKNNPGLISSTAAPRVTPPSPPARKR